MLIEHPIVVVEELLKLNIGDEGRLLYLRKAITKGQTIYHSDKEFLKRMLIELDEVKSEKIIKLEKSNDAIKLDSRDNNPFDKKNKSNSLKTNKGFSKEKNYEIKNNFEFEIQSIQNSISELKSKNSKIKDNLGLLFLSHKKSKQIKNSKLNNLGSFSNLTKSSSSNLFSLFKNNSILKNSWIFEVKKHTFFVYMSTGLFVLWFIGFQNLIDLGSLQNFSLALSAGSATAAFRFYKKQKNSKK